MGWLYPYPYPPGAIPSLGGRWEIKKEKEERLGEREVDEWTGGNLPPWSLLHAVTEDPNQRPMYQVWLGCRRRFYWSYNDVDFVQGSTVWFFLV
jgi:hypothetical protein